MLSRSEVEHLEMARRDAMVEANLEKMAKIFSDDLTWIHASGVVDNKASLLRKFELRVAICNSIEFSDVDVRLLETTALVTGVINLDAVLDGVRRSAAARYTAVWVTKESAACLLHWQSTRLPLS